MNAKPRAGSLVVRDVLARRCYRLVPRSVRLSLLANVSPLTQYRIAQRVLRRSLISYTDDVDDVIVTIGGRRHRAILDRQATPLSVRQFNLDFVVATLADAGIDYFAIPHDPGIRSRIGVAAADWDVALATLAAAAAGQGVVITPVAGRRHTPCRWVYRPTATGGSWLTFGPGYGCEIEAWETEGGALVAPQPNAVCSRLPAQADRVAVAANTMSTFAPADGGRTYVTRRQFAVQRATSIDFPIDVIYTWVDGSDPRWRQRWLTARGDHDILSEQAANDSRYLDREELRYSLRSLHLYAPWIRNIYIVTDDQLPYWLDTSRPGVSVISHRDLFEPGSRLPTFNSHAIESQLYRTPGLAEHFIYFNDDVFLGRPVTPDTFFHGNGVAKFFLSRSAPLDSGEPSFGDIPVDAAGKNNREVLRERFGRTVTQKMKHTPHAMRRSVLEKISTELREHVTRTRDNQFRHPTDLSIASSLHHYWSYLEGTSVPGSLRYLYTDLADPETATRLIRLLRQRDFHTFCLNDTDSDPATRVEMAALISLFLSQYFPVRSPFELTPEREADRRGIGATNLAEMMHGASAVAAAAAAIVDATTVTSSTALSFGRSADDRLAIGIGAGIQRVAPLDEQMQTTDSAMR
jgi:Stealth protein CR2, conserved region 2/Stealth protein CR3, conserved region 3/Stealth protein CR4, conserved region 4/Stealth protein CR1, conserved region 1